MASKYELTISTGYVPDWTYVQAIRELFQNALDGEIMDSENKMFMSYKDSVLKIGNKTSVLTLDSLLLGTSTKRSNDKTIGQHGEGYKIAFMVLLREGKKVTVYNYMKREIWTTRLVKAKRYAGAYVPELIITKMAAWDGVPEKHLVIEIMGVTDDEYKELITNNLHLQSGYGTLTTEKGEGVILTDKEYAGKVFVNGLFVCNAPKFAYGYNLAPSIVKLDRDRCLIDTIDLAFLTSRIWKSVNEAKLVSDMIEGDCIDVKYLHSVSHMTYDTNVGKKANDEIANEVHKSFIDKHGDKAIPVKDTVELEEVLGANKGYKPVIVNETTSTYLKGKIDKPIFTERSPKERLGIWLERVRYHLSAENIDEFQSILDDMN